MRIINLALLSFALIGYTQCKHNVLDFGAVGDLNDTASAFQNANAFQQAVVAANSSLDDREVYLPEGYTLHMMPSNFSNLRNITFTVDSYVYLSSDNENWPVNNNKVVTWLVIDDSEYITIQGSGTIDGQGYWWWMREYIVANKHRRPDIVNMHRVRHAVFEGVRYLNSPQFHISVVDIDDFLFQNFEIYVDIYEQKKLAQKHGYFDYQLNIPTFPLNTDGIDPAGTNVIIRNVSITNFDDAVAVKPSNSKYQIAKCSSNILIENCNVTYGVGMSLGTVVPHDTHTCISDVTVRNINFNYPFKAIYIKTNPGDEGDGLIANIIYENIKINEPIWWAIYIGPQQQQQPDGRGPGCMFYPLNKDCETQPRVTIRNVTLRNIESTNGLLPPGIIRCNVTNPCRDINFDNVQMKGWFNQLNLGFITEYIMGTAVNSKPAPHYITEEEWNQTISNLTSSQTWAYQEYQKMLSN